MCAPNWNVSDGLARSNVGGDRDRVDVLDRRVRDRAPRVLWVRSAGFYQPHSSSMLAVCTAAFHFSRLAQRR